MPSAPRRIATSLVYACRKALACWRWAGTRSPISLCEWASAVRATSPRCFAERSAKRRSATRAPAASSKRWCERALRPRSPACRRAVSLGRARTLRLGRELFERILERSDQLSGSGSLVGRERQAGVDQSRDAFRQQRDREWHV